jgi:hypothetical protein
MTFLCHRPNAFILFYYSPWSRKQNTAVGIRCANYAKPLYPQKLALTSPTSGGCSVCVFAHRLKPRSLFVCYYYYYYYYYYWSDLWTSWPESVGELYWPSDRRLSAKLMPTFADRGCHVVSGQCDGSLRPYSRLSRPDYCCCCWRGGKLLIMNLLKMSGFLLGLIDSLTILFHSIAFLAKSSLEGANGDSTDYSFCRRLCNFAFK